MRLNLADFRVARPRLSSHDPTFLCSYGQLFYKIVPTASPPRARASRPPPPGRRRSPASSRTSCPTSSQTPWFAAGERRQVQSLELLDDMLDLVGNPFDRVGAHAELHLRHQDPRRGAAGSTSAPCSCDRPAPDRCRISTSSDSTPPRYGGTARETSRRATASTAMWRLQVVWNGNGGGQRRRRRRAWKDDQIGIGGRDGCGSHVKNPHDEHERNRTEPARRRQETRTNPECHAIAD